VDSAIGISRLENDFFTATTLGHRSFFRRKSIVYAWLIDLSYLRRWSDIWKRRLKTVALIKLKNTWWRIKL
jgi:hypothetical protein